MTLVPIAMAHYKVIFRFWLAHGLWLKLDSTSNCCHELSAHVTAEQQHMHGIYVAFTQLNLPLELLQSD